jgi:hypothetical protein
MRRRLCVITLAPDQAKSRRHSGFAAAGHRTVLPRLPGGADIFSGGELIDPVAD